MLKKILVVEDNEDNRRILVYRLRKIGKFDIREAANGQQAIDAVRADLPDLIFMDLKMPAHPELRPAVHQKNIGLPGRPSRAQPGLQRPDDACKRAESQLRAVSSVGRASAF